MAKVLKVTATADSQQNYVEKDFTAANEVWIEFKVRYTAAALAFWGGVGNRSGDFAEFSSGPFAYVGVNIQPGPLWEAYGPTNFLDSDVPNSDVWITIEMHWKINDANGVQVYIDNVLFYTESTVGDTTQMDSAEIGLINNFNASANTIAYFDDVKIGTTRHGTQIFSDDFESGGTGNWTAVQIDGAIAVIDDPFVGPVDYIDSGTESFKLTPITTEEGLDDGLVVPYKFTPSGADIAAFVDSGTELFKLTPSGHDCYAIATPDYELLVEKRWDMETIDDRWNAEPDTRWNCFIIGTSFEIPC